jgi:hypothetical protein
LFYFAIYFFDQYLFYFINAADVVCGGAERNGEQLGASFFLSMIFCHNILEIYIYFGLFCFLSLPKNQMCVKAIAATPNVAKGLLAAIPGMERVYFTIFYDFLLSIFIYLFFLTYYLFFFASSGQDLSRV